MISINRFNRKLLASFMLVVFFIKAQAQIPTSCFEIESILVAACGQPEGENEMVRFIVGPAAVNVNTLNASWPNGGNPWRSICTNATTAAKVATLNVTINTCGLVLEPIAGILPAGSRVVLVTSVNMDVSANSFANLTDTIYMIFQCTGNTQGHFKNYGVNAGSRTLSMTFGSGCTDVVTYYPGNLTTSAGNVGDGPGATVMFNWPGQDTYRNFGCQAPIDFPEIELQANKASMCIGDSVFLGTTVQNLNVIGASWSGGSGTFTSPATANTYYVAGPGDNGSVKLKINITGSCGNNLTDSITINIPGNFTATLNTEPLPPYCDGVTVTLFAAGSNATNKFNWSTGATTSSIKVSGDGTYYVINSNACYSYLDSAVIKYSSVNAAFISDLSSGPSPLTVSFFDKSTNAVLHQYDFGDGFTDNTTDPVHTFEAAGIYNVLLTVKNIEGCTDQVSNEIVVSGDTVAFFPSAFTPNNDGANELFRPLGANIINSEGIIYNRWGEKIFSWENSRGWDGYSKGKAAEQGIYGYSTDITFVWGETVRKKGWVMLLR